MTEDFNGADRRQFKRLRLKFSVTVVFSKDKPIDVHISDGTKEYRAIMLDISEGGMSIIADVNIPISTNIWVKFTLARVENECVDFYGVMEMKGEVRYNIPLEDGTFRLGICFVDISERHRTDIINFMEMLEKRCKS